MNDRTNLSDFLEFNEKQPIDSQLCDEKIKILKLASKYADIVYRYKLGKRYKWKLIFDDGVFKGQFEIIIDQKDLTALALLNAIDAIGWPGFQRIVNECNKSILEVLDKSK